MVRENAWKKYDQGSVNDVMDFAEEYRTFISDCKTERECVVKAVDMARKAGYKDLADVIRDQEVLREGDKVYAVNQKKSIILFHIGSEPMENGLNILGAHIDSPRLDIKQNPLYEDELSHLVLLDTHYYGGVKKYQWVAMPLALHGVVTLKSGKTVDIVIGEDEKDPVIGISDLLIHLAAKQMEKKADKVIEGEDMNLLIGSMPKPKDKGDVSCASKEDEKVKNVAKASAKADSSSEVGTGNSEEDKHVIEQDSTVKNYILDLLNQKYGIEEEDFLSAELEAVPAGKARDYGIDSSMIMGYGHDDRVCAYPSLIAQLKADRLKRTGVCILVDKEEIGSVGATGMHSRFFENMVAEVMDRVGGYSELKLRRALTNSKMLSSDVTAAYDPNYPDVYEKKNTAYFGHGMVFNKYTGSRGKSGSNDASAEFIGELRKIMDENNVSFQASELGKVDAGGGGTIAYILANYGMNVIDSGVAVQNMHAPYEVISKVDLYETLKGYQAFLQNA